MSDTWEALVGSALIGTERRGELPPTLRDDPVLAGVAVLAPPEQILAAAALLGSARRAGWQPGRPAAGATPSSPVPDAPRASPDALALFELLAGGMLELPGGRDWLLARWLERCATRGQRPPPKTLAWLLDQASAVPALRRPVIAAGGTLAAWLGECNPAWAWARPPAPVPVAIEALQATWRTATRGERLSLLGAARRTNPALGHQLVASSLATAPAAERVALVQGLAEGLEAQDEALLEALLDDRSTPVREAALTLLAAMATAGRGRRMAERLEPLVQLSGGGRLVVEFPGPPGESARRDGVGGFGPPGALGPSGAGGGLGERAQWLLQMVAGAPLATWTNRFARPPEELLILGAEHPALLGGWLQAARYQRDGRWVIALVALGGAPPDLARLLDPPEGSALLQRSMVDSALSHPRAAALMANCAGPWSIEASSAVIARLAGAQKQLSFYGLALPALAANLHPGVSSELQRWLDRLGGGDRVSRGFHGLAHALGLRQRIDEVFPDP